MKGSCVLFLLNLQNKLVGFILAPLLSERKKIKRTEQIGVVYFSSITYDKDDCS
jgi:hypothetical protein